MTAVGDGGATPTDASAAGEPDGGDEAGSTDAGIAPFGPSCQADDTTETEPNDVPGLATPFTHAACGNVRGIGDSTDYLGFTLPKAAPLSIAFAASGDAKFSLSGSGINFVSGAKSGGGFSTRKFANAQPGDYVVQITASMSQSWRIVVEQP